ncbi:MAG: hypothetical protein KDA22_15425 [Phycisphaerales bacterium]|nr:hypothetical protein [Phycisphaerales bacterium]
MSRLRGAAILVSAAGALLAAGACNIVGPVAFIIEGPPKTPAMFELPDRPTVVFVDDRKNVLPRSSLRMVIGDTAAEALLTSKTLTKTISARDAINLARVQETGRKPMSIDAIGEAVGADIVIYVNMVSFGEADLDGLPRPTAAAEVRVIDVVNDVRLFPVDVGSPQYVQAVGDPVSPEMTRSASMVRQIEDVLAARLGAEVAKLFYEHETKPLGEHTG